MRVSTTMPDQIDPSRTLRRTAADAIERIRTLSPLAGDQAAVREVATIALGALSTALFTDADDEAAGHRLLAPLVVGDMARIADILGITQPIITTAGPSSARPS